MKKGIFCALIGMGLLSGCQAPKRRAKTIAPRPEPVYIGRQIGPVLSPPSDPVPITAPTVSVRHPWMPKTILADRWQCIVIHHTATEKGGLDYIQKMHLDKGWENGCGYHFVIGNGTLSANGQVEPSFRWKQQIHGGHTKLIPEAAARQSLDINYYNDHGIGIGLVGNFNKDRPSPGQLENLIELLEFLMDRCNVQVSRIYGHGQLKPTDCPGKNFSLTDLKNRLKSGR
jgi:hypothetical protein